MRLLALLLVALPAVPASAQSFNIDVGQNLILYPVPADTYGAGAGQIGRWNSCPSPYTTNLVNLDGSASSVTTASNQSSSYSNFFSTLTGDDYNFMVDVQDLPFIGGPQWSWTFAGLQDGSYTIYTYAWAPENNGNTSLVTVPGSIDPPTVVGGTWTGSPHVQNVTYSVHHLDVVGGTFQVLVEGQNNHNGSVNGFQLVRTGGGSGPVTFCSGDGTATACPCGNAGGAGRGCANSVNASGARIAAQGSASVANDTLVLAGDGMPNSSALYFQGTGQQGGGAGAVFGDGLRCAGGSITRLGTKQNASGASAYPSAGDPSVSVRGNCAAGDVRTYQIWYRNAAAFCTAATFNLSNGVQVTWGA
jgi:hypothetical protein